jgi:hypothetical protein
MATVTVADKECPALENVRRYDPEFVPTTISIGLLA